jgi:hypothetical protein
MLIGPLPARFQRAIFQFNAAIEHGAFGNDGDTPARREAEVIDSYS